MCGEDYETAEKEEEVGGNEYKAKESEENGSPGRAATGGDGIGKWDSGKGRENGNE